MVKKQRNKITDTEAPARIIAIMFMVGIGGIIIFGIPTLVKGVFFTRIFAAFAVAFSFLPKRYYPFIFRIKPRFRVLLNIAGLAPMATALVLCINYFIYTNKYTTSYKVRYTVYYHYDDEFELQLEDNYLADHNYIRRFKKQDYQGIHDSVHYTIANGIFGMSVIKDKSITLKFK